MSNQTSAPERDTSAGVERTWGLLGVPSSAAAHWPGLEKGPAAIRAAGLVESLRQASVDLVDHGDLPEMRWQGIRTCDRPNNWRSAVDEVAAAAQAIADVIGHGHAPLVIGGDCTLAVATVSAAVDAWDDVGLVYVDGGQDLMIPVDHPREPILDGMGVAHLLDLPGCLPELTGVGSRRPLLRAENVVFVGYGDEEEDIHGLVPSVRLPGAELMADPPGTARQALAALAAPHLIVHVDVDVLDPIRLPLADIPSYGSGVELGHLTSLLRVLLADPRVVAMTLVEANPDHDAPDGSSARRLVAAVADAYRPDEKRVSRPAGDPRTSDGGRQDPASATSPGVRFEGAGEELAQLRPLRAGQPVE